jgi:hypothetical protein
MVPELGLARPGGRRGLEAVVQRIADHVDERIADLLDDGAVELGVLAAGGEGDLLAEVAGEIAGEALHFLEGGLDRDHAQRHGGVLQFLGDATELGDVALQGEPSPPPVSRRLDELALHDHEFADDIHQESSFSVLTRTVLA